MSTIVTRAGKGAALTWTEGDANITNLNNDKMEKSTPVLAGNLDVATYSITTTTTNGNIVIEPNGTGDLHVITEALRIGDLNAEARISTYGTGNLVLDGLNWPQADGTANYVLKTNGSGQLSWVAQTTAFDPASPGSIGGTTPSTGTFTSINFKNPIEPVYSLGTTGGTIAPDPANGSVQSITLNSALTFNAFTNPTAGESLTLIINGGTAYTSITSTMKFAGGVKTLTGTAGCIDILSVFYDGTTYYASLGKGFA